MQETKTKEVKVQVESKPVSLETTASAKETKQQHYRPNKFFT